MLRTWGKANADTLVKYLEAYVEGLRWSFDPKNKSEAVGLLVERLKLPDDIAAQSYDSTKDGFNPDGLIDMEGVRNVLKLRAQFEGGTRQMRKNIWTCHTIGRRAPGFENSVPLPALTDLDFAIDLVGETHFADGEDHLGLNGFVTGETAVSHRRPDRLFDLLLRGHAYDLEEFAQRHVEGFFVHLKAP